MFKIISILTAVLLLFTSSVEAQKTNTANKKRFSISAKSWVVADVNGKIIKGANTNDLRSIASITKLMTAMVVLDANQDLNERIEKFTRRQHLQLALIKSNNHSADLLC